MAFRKTAKVIRKHTHPRIQLQLVLFTIIAIIMFGLVIFDVLTQGATLWLVILGAVVGIAGGYGLGWAFKVKWHKDSKNVVQSTNKWSLLLIALYIVIRLGGQQVLGHYVHGEMLTALLYSLIAGLMTGRLIALTRRVNKVLKVKNLL